jgi:hypothetical protein
VRQASHIVDVEVGRLEHVPHHTGCRSFRFYARNIKESQQNNFTCPFLRGFLIVTRFFFYLLLSRLIWACATGDGLMLFSTGLYWAGPTKQPSVDRRPMCGGGRQWPSRIGLDRQSKKPRKKKATKRTHSSAGLNVPALLCFYYLRRLLAFPPRGEVIASVDLI